MLGMPATTDFDLRFRLLGIPVRVHPMFWLITAVLGYRDGDLRGILIWVVCVLVSILVHEFGHGLMSRAFGYSPSVVLYGMGGLCYSEGQQTPGQRLAVLFCGPGAGFLLAALIFGGYQALGRPTLGPAGHDVYDSMMMINIAWGILNLFPIWPLDGGQITGVFANLISRRNGMRSTHIISLLASCLLAYLMFRLGSTFMAIFFAFFALTNFQMLQAIQHQSVQYGDEADWWKR